MIDDEFMIALHKLGVFIVISVTALASALALFIYIQEHIDTKSVEISTKNPVGPKKLF